MTISRTIIITAGGSGTRMGKKLPKQFLSLAGKPILMRTIEKFHDFDPDMQIILVLPHAHSETWNELCMDNKFKLNIELCEGGNERFHSIKNGLTLATGDVIGVHDGVRPLVSSEVIANCFLQAETLGSAVPAIPVHSSIRRIIDGNSVAKNRTEFRLIQTPQCFKRDWIMKAYQQDYNSAFTDDASVVESAGYKINLVEGNEENIKITTPIDLKIAAVLVQ